MFFSAFFLSLWDFCIQENEMMFSDLHAHAQV